MEAVAIELDAIPTISGTSTMLFGTWHAARGTWPATRALALAQEAATQREAALQAELDLAQAKVRDLQQRLFGRNSERSKGASERQPRAGLQRFRRGQRRGTPGHGRKLLAHLPERIETVGLDVPPCPACAEALNKFPDTEDSEVREIEVRG